jgi:hypothetical protein
MFHFGRDPRKMIKGGVFKYFAVVTFAFLFLLAPAIAASLFDPGPRTNPATNRCNLYDASCKPRQLFVRPPEPSSKNSPVGRPARKLILPRDLNDRSGTSALLPGEPNRRIYRALTCNDARRVIRHAGYRNIRTVKCGGKFHHFTAQRRGTKYRLNLKVRATTGKILVISRVRWPVT